MTKNKKSVFWMLLILVFFGFVFWSVQHPRENNEVKIGVILSLTGDVGPYGQRSLRGLQIAEQEINARGGINGRKIRLVVEDAKSSPKDAVSAFQKLVNLDKLHVVIGDVLSGTTLAIAPIAEKEKVLLFAPGASNPSLRDAGDYIFRNWVSDDFDGKAMADYMYANGFSQAFVLFQQTDYAVGLADAFKKEFERRGGKLEGQEGFVTEATDFRLQLGKLQMSDSNTVYLIGESRQNGTILRQARELGIKAQWFANLTVDTPECQSIAGVAREGTIFTTPAFDATSNEPQVAKYVQEFRKAYREDPEVTSGVAYDALMILASVMGSTGDNSDKVKNALYQIKDFPGVTGRTTFDDHGDVIKDLFIKEIKDGKPILVRTFSSQLQ